ncbi:MAG: excinuclease ABC subunit UvrC [Oscillospiraceae bacterium]|nr:excinuclease ABC subunit UvrC [Oscillospiraceae bacterium]
MNEQIDFLKEKCSKLPATPGVYLMKNRSNDDPKCKVIYVGKAKHLKNRVSTYFVGNAKRDRKTAKLVEHIRDFDYIVTLKEIDAFVLETSLIKQYRPKYNILLKDAKGFNYVKITADEYPRLQYTLNADDKKAKYIGPYVGGFFVKQSVEDANRIFLLPSCNRKFPESFGKIRSCLNHRIKRCMGVCQGTISRDEYSDIVNLAVDYIKNGSKASIANLTNEMNEAAEALDFEKAVRLRDRIAAMKRADTVQSVISSKLTDYDVIGMFVNYDGLTAVAVVKYSGGRLVDKQSFELGDVYEKSQMLRDFILEYYSSRIDGNLDKSIEVYIESEIIDQELLEKHLKISLKIPKRGEGLSQIMLARSNAEEILALKLGRTTKETLVLEELANLLGLTELPRRIECFDISNIGESVKVGGMVTYRDGKPYKKDYRKFTIKTVDGLDDYGCMREIIERRYKSDDDRLELPQLILVDGGIGHVSVVKGVLEELGFGVNFDGLSKSDSNDKIRKSVNLFGLVKDSKHRTRAIATSNREGESTEIQIQANKKVFTFLTKLQDEVHRFTVTFARERHQKSSFDLSLRQVPGIGEVKATLLLKHFKTKTALKSATFEELSCVAKLSSEKAQVLFEFVKTM